VDEDQGGMIDKLNSHQLQAEAEAVLLSEQATITEHAWEMKTMRMM